MMTDTLTQAWALGPPLHRYSRLRAAVQAYIFRILDAVYIAAGTHIRKPGHQRFPSVERGRQ